MKQHYVERMLYIVLVLTFIAVGMLSVFQWQSNARLATQQAILQQQVSGQKEVLKGVQTLLSNQGKTTSQINNSLSCILVFFGKQDRASYYISDLTNCTITNTSTGESEILPITHALPLVTPSTDPPKQDDHRAEEQIVSEPPETQEPIQEPEPPAQEDQQVIILQPALHAVDGILDSVTDLIGIKP